MTQLYSLLLTTHSLLRWVVLLAAVLAVLRAAFGLLGKRAWRPLDDRLGLILSITVDLQVLVGLLMWPFYLGIVGFNMRDDASRRFLVEHPLAMLAALALIHIGRARVRKQADDAGKFKQALIFFGLALLLMLLLIPWERLF